MASATSPALIKLQSCDSQIFEVECRIIQQSVTIKNMLDSIGEALRYDELVPIPDITGDVLRKVIQYLVYHDNHPNDPSPSAPADEPAAVTQTSITITDGPLAQTDGPLAPTDAVAIVSMDTQADIADASALVCSSVKQEKQDIQFEETTQDNEVLMQTDENMATTTAITTATSASKENEAKDKTELSPWDKEFFNVQQNELFDIILAANYLDIKPLFDAGCKTVADMIKGKTPDEIRDLFHIKNDFTPEDEERIRNAPDWLVDDL